MGNMLHVGAQVEEAAGYVRGRWQDRPRVGIILGSGLGGVAEAIDVELAIGYGEIPRFVASTAAGHRGRLICGRLGGVPVVAMQGRLHLYEGYSATEVTLPVRVMKSLGAEVLVVSNAAGGLNPRFAVGDVMVIDDHVNFMTRNPLVGVNDDRLGPRCPDMSAPYDRELADRALAIARRDGFTCHRGTYVATLGPTYETRAEIRMLRWLGADAVGMSTVPEVIVAAHAGLRILGLSTITNVSLPDAPHVTREGEVVAAAAAASEKLRAIVAGVIEEFVCT
jgi:purine-nucleoside phosphorylase